MIENDDEQNEELDDTETVNESSNGKFRNLVKNPIGAFGKSLKGRIGGFSNIIDIVKKYKIYFIITVVMLLIISVSIIVLAIVKSSSTTVTGSISNYLTSNELLDENSESIKLYNKKASLIKFSVKEINAIYNKFYEDGSFDKETFEALNKKYGETLLDNTNNESRILDENDKVELYKHILFTEKYNFNKIKWKTYGHGYSDEDSEMQEDKELGLVYPKDQNNTKIETLIDFALPYLQSWYIPLAFNSGSLSGGTTSETAKNSNFTYTIIKEAFSDILVNRYDLQKYTLNTKYNKYKKITRHQEYTVIKTGMSYSVSDVKVVIDSEEDVNERLDSSGNVDPLKESKVNDVVSIKNKYFIKEANTFDTIQANEFNYTQYNVDDTKKRKNFKSEIETRVEDYNEVQNAPSFDLNSVTSAGVYSGGSYTEKSGTTHYITRTWEDSLTQTANETKSYTYDDIIEYNSDNSDNPDKKEISEEDFESDSNSENYYKYYSDNEQLNKIDIINSNPGIYKKYIPEGSEYSDYIGYSRSYLTYSYSELKSLFTSVVTSNGVLPFVYGQSLGFDKSALNSGSNNIGSGSITGMASMLQSAIDLAEKKPWHYCWGTAAGHLNHPLHSSDNTLLGRFSFSTLDEMNKYLNIGDEAGFDCSSFVWSMYKTYLGIDIAGGAGNSASSGISGVAFANDEKILPGTDNVTVNIEPSVRSSNPTALTDLDALKPGDILYRVDPGHVAIYIGKIDGKHMMVDHGGGSPWYECNYNTTDWRGPYYHEVPTSGQYVFNYYIRYTRPMVSDDIFNSGTVSASEQQELLNLIDQDMANIGSTTGWGTTNGAWTLRYYMDDPVELISRMVTHENSVSESDINNEGAREMVKCQALIIIKRAKAAGSVYNAIISPKQFYSLNQSAGNRFNKAPAQWVRELVYNIYNGIEPKPSYWDEDAYYWIGPADTSSWSWATQIVGIKISDSTWHVLAKNGNQNYSVAEQVGDRWIFKSTKNVPGYTSVFE